MQGRHHTHQVRQWAPTAAAAVLAATPATSMLAAFGCAGAGYLVHDSTLAATGSALGGFGLLAERWQGRELRRRLRRERARFRAQANLAGMESGQLRRELDQLRADLDGARQELDLFRAQLASRPTVDLFTPARGLAAAGPGAPLSPAPAAGVRPAGWSPSIAPLRLVTPPAAAPAAAGPAPAARPVPAVAPAAAVGPGGDATSARGVPVMPLSELSTASAAHRFPAASAPAASAPAAQASVPVLADHPEFGPAAATGAPGQGWVHEPVEAPSRRSGGRRAAAAAAGPMAAGPMAAGQLAVGPVGASAAGVRPPVQGGPSPVSGPIRLTDSPAEPLFPLLSPGPSAPLGGTPAPFGPRDATGPLAVVVDLRTVPQPVISTGPRSREAVDALAYAAIRSAGAGLHPAGDSGPSTGSLLVVGAGASVTPHLAATRAAGRSQPGRHQA